MMDTSPLLLSFVLLLLALVEGSQKDGYFYEGQARIGVANDFFQFRSRPDLLAPRWNITTYDAKALSPGFLFVAPYKNLATTKRGEAWIGPHIYDQLGELVWSGAPLFDHYKAFDLRLAKIDGSDMLTAIYPHDNSAVILNKHYEIVQAIVHSSDWEYSNMHDFNVVENGKRALVLTKDAATRVSREKSQAVGFDGKCLVRGDGLKYMDIASTPPVTLFEWNGTDHIGLDETQVHGDLPINDRCTDHSKWDIHHFNAIDIFPDGDILVSARSTSTLYKISPETGEIVWRIGGIKSDFDLPPEAMFNFQHHARVHSQNGTHATISLLDNSKGDADTDSDDWAPRSHSAGLILSLDARTMTGRLVHEYPYPHGGYTRKRGSAHILPNSNVFMGWADNILVSEHAPGGRLLMEGRILPALDSYRSYKFPWVGEPLNPPDVVSTAFLSGNATWTHVHVSWNGATEVATWRLHEFNDDNGSENSIAAVHKTGFETAIAHEGFMPYLVIEALSKRGKSLGKSKVVRTTPPVEADVEPPSAHSDSPPSFDTAQATASSSSLASSEATDHPLPDQQHDTKIGDDMPTDLAQHTDRLILLSGLSGFVLCAVLCGVLVAFRKTSWAGRKDLRYEAVPVSDEEVH